jgi:hypothetical protein
VIFHSYVSLPEGMLKLCLLIPTGMHIEDHRRLAEIETQAVF